MSSTSSRGFTTKTVYRSVILVQSNADNPTIGTRNELPHHHTQGRSPLPFLSPLLIRLCLPKCPNRENVRSAIKISDRGAPRRSAFQRSFIPLCISQRGLMTSLHRNRSQDAELLSPLRKSCITFPTILPTSPPRTRVPSGANDAHDPVRSLVTGGALGARK